jgi:mannobiose 2-epimerase
MRIAMLISCALLSSASIVLGQAATAPTTKPVPPTKASYLRVAAEVEKSLQDDDLKKFFPAAVDNQGGGFFESFSENWTHTGLNGRGNASTDTTRSVVYQSRLTWLAAQAAMRYPAEAEKYLAIARHGAKFLEEKQWDAKNGGFWWAVDTNGVARSDSKHAYGNSFAIYALATSYKATHDPDALDYAKKGFAWMEKNAHDEKNGGYFEQIRGDGSLITAAAAGGDIVGARNGQKSMNSHIHLLESFTALLEVWPDDLVKKRTEELYQIGLTKIYSDPGYLYMFFSPDWTPVAGRDSYGHDIETAFLFADAAAALGKPDDPACWRAGRNIVDHCLKVAFSPTEGCLYNEGTVDGSGTPDKSKVWWVQAEALNALLLMHDRYGQSDPKYWNAFVQEWNFISAHQIDHQNGGWYNTLNPDKTPLRSKIAKTDSWTEGYHQGRSMLTVTATLKRLADANN